MAISMGRRWPTSTMAGAGRSPPARNCATTSMGFCVAERPIRTGGRWTRASRRSSESARCAPRLSSAMAWISSTITVSTLRRMARLFSAVSRMYSDSGVVTRMCGGRTSMDRRSRANVSPVRTMVRISGMSRPRAPAICRISPSGTSRFFWMSFPRAFSGETYRTSVTSSSAPDNALRTRRSMQARKAARVLPEPVGAEMMVLCRARMCGQPCSCGSVGVPKRCRNHSRTMGWAQSRALPDAGMGRSMTRTELRAADT
jgi:hypothetical protein